MRRTYKSKKDTGGALDHRDVLLNMDEKRSAFDAFYIQNIKQTKRELSCVTSSNHVELASKKVRKRKYVKRIVKEAEPVRQRETMSSSAFLTPDKSIRVNKVLDPFDMLLNSSPAHRNISFKRSSKEKKEVSKDKTFDKCLPKKESKTYTRKRQPKTKKLNYSSTDSDCSESNKENTTDLKSNISDIRTHELLVEKELSDDPKYLDESIIKIVNNLSLLNNFKRKISNNSFNTSYKCRNRINNFQSPILQKSPLCSTPFKEKYRGVSIYKFSPISLKEQEMSPNSILEEKNESNVSIILTANSKVLRKYQASPLTRLPTLSIKYGSNSSVNDARNKSNISKYEGTTQSEIEYIKNETKTSILTNNEQSSFQTTEDEPFLGFSNKTSQNVNRDDSCLLESLEESKSIQEENLDLCEKEIMSYKDVFKDTLKSNSSNSDASYTCQLKAGSQNSDKESFYDTCDSEQSSPVNSLQSNREPVVTIERMSSSIFMKYYEKMQVESQDKDNSDQTDNEGFESLSNSQKNDSNKVLDNSLSTEGDCIESKPNAIVITDSSTTDDVISIIDESNDEEENDDATGSNNEKERYVSFVTTRRGNEITNDSMFIFDNSYGSSSTDCDKTVLSKVNVNSENSDADINAEYSCRQNSIDVCTSEKSYISEEDSKFILSPPGVSSSRISSLKSPNMPRESIIARANDVKFTESRAAMQTISRISTRKRSKLPKQTHSIRPELDASKSERTLVDANETVGEVDFFEIGLNDLEDEANSLNTKNTSRMIQGDSITNHSERPSFAGAEAKPSIVLQPGKKWERSLSIFRRMTMAADNFDQSILEDECLQRKGRKYRQSVISTMEMQEYKDLLHNDSINSRRSTFISKPSRPTVRFVKDSNISISRVSLNTTSIFDDLKGFLNEECDDTVIELSKLSIADSEHEITILDNFHETERVATARDYVLRRCNQTEPILFDECYPETVLKNCHKIGEGVYGEVFLWRGRDGRARVMKIVPIAGSIKVNGEDQKDFHEIISEIVIAMELSALRAPIADIERQLDEGNDIHALQLNAIENASDTFNEVLAVRCVYGAYPSRLLDLWELYDECKGSENDSPAALPVDQRYIVLELANAGQDLESYQFAGAQQAHALFQQIAFGLAVAEEAFQFEHRDLHWGNVLIAPTEQKLATFILRGRVHRVPRCGVAATIIDYSLSRLTLPLATDSAALYNDLATDEQLFDAVGDYQFEVYRLMRDKLGNDWKNFEPYTNILWLHYTVDKMITALRYKRTNTKIHKHYIEKLKGIKNRILEYGSAVQYVLTDIDF